ncbi:MAG: DUF6265 family protein [Bacteroidota bacterium]
MKVLILLLFPIILITSCYNPSPNDTINDLKIIVGNWQSHKGVAFNENWRFVNQNIFEGEGFSLNGTDTAFFESLKIEKINDSIYYKVYFDEDAESVDFLLTEATKNKWKFVNHNNDFPSIIIYHIENDTLLNVTISNIRGNKEQFFYMEKIN